MGWDGNKLHYFFNGSELPSGNNGEMYYMVSCETNYRDSDHGRLGDDYIVLYLTVKTNSGYINIGEITRKYAVGMWGNTQKSITYDGHTISWTGDVGYSNSALYIDGQYVGILRGEYYFKM